MEIRMVMVMVMMMMMATLIARFLLAVLRRLRYFEFLSGLLCS